MLFRSKENLVFDLRRFVDWDKNIRDCEKSLWALAFVEKTPFEMTQSQRILGIISVLAHTYLCMQFRIEVRVSVRDSSHD